MRATRTTPRSVTKHPAADGIHRGDQPHTDGQRALVVVHTTPISQRESTWTGHGTKRKTNYNQMKAVLQQHTLRLYSGGSSFECRSDR